MCTQLLLWMHSHIRTLTQDVCTCSAFPQVDVPIWQGLSTFSWPPVAAEHYELCLLVIVDVFL